MTIQTHTRTDDYVELTRPDGRKSKLFSITNHQKPIDDWIKDGSTAEYVTEVVTWRGENGKRKRIELSRVPMTTGDLF